MTFALIPLSAKQTSPTLAGEGGNNCSAFTIELIFTALSLSALSVTVTDLDLINVGIFLSLVALFSFAEILFGSERNLDLVALDNFFHSYG